LEFAQEGLELRSGAPVQAGGEMNGAFCDRCVQAADEDDGAVAVGSAVTVGARARERTEPWVERTVARQYERTTIEQGTQWKTTFSDRDYLAMD